MIYTIKNDHLTASIDSLGAELVSLIGGDGYEYIWNGEEWKGHAPVLFPVCGRLYGAKYSYRGKEYSMRIHGIAHYTKFKAVDVKPDEITLELTESEDTLAVYPFAFSLKARYKLVGNKLNADFTVKNKDGKDLPFMFGWHPAFNLGGEAPISDFKIDFGEGTELWQFPPANECFIDRHSYPFPHGSAFRLESSIIYEYDTILLTGDVHRAVLSSSSERHSVEMCTSDNLGYFAIWKKPVDAARYVCLEPWSGIPADGNGPEDLETKPTMTKLKQGQTEIFSYAVTLN